jgi:hypothetical protein
MSNGDNLLGLPDYWRLREEARKSWDYLLTDELVHVDKVGGIEFDPFFDISKRNIYCCPWLEIRIWLGRERECQYTAIVERFRMNLLRRLNTRKLNVKDTGMYREMAMFLNIPERMKTPQMGGFVRRATIVRLKLSDSGNRLFGNTFGSIGDYPLCTRSKLTDDGELNLPTREFWQSGKKGQLPCEMIKGGTEATNEVSDYERKREGRLIKNNGNNILRGLQVLLSRVSIGLRFSELVDPRIQRVQVFLRPTHFQIGTS